MARFINRESVIKKLSSIEDSNSKEIKGLNGELYVGDLLEKYLEPDVAIIWQPSIGFYEPDFLIISPSYGFRLVEVKNWNESNLVNINSNGLFILRNFNSSPLSQVKKQADGFRRFLISNYYFQEDCYKKIGYIVIQTNMQSKKLIDFSKSWDPLTLKEFEKFHVFQDELNSFKINEKMRNASRYQPETLDENVMENVIMGLTNNRSFLEVNENRFKLNPINNDLIDERANYLVKKENKITSRDNQVKEEETTWLGKAVLYGMGFILWAWIISGVFMGLDNVFNFVVDTSQTDIIAIENYTDAFIKEDIPLAFNRSENYVSVDAYVKTFNYDSKSRMKFLTLEVLETGYVFPAVITPDIKAPYLIVGDIYRFHGTTQEYNEKIELNLTAIEDIFKN